VVSRFLPFRASSISLKAVYRICSEKPDAHPVSSNPASRIQPMTFHVKVATIPATFCGNKWQRNEICLF
ncbi:hypothetical protein, partial [Pantoea wallisii]|uniref:hypothetical protein n=1 Tax=Pantoea wallisii TaxID=1076551 RepID=UPI001ABFE689